MSYQVCYCVLYFTLNLIFDSSYRCLAHIINLATQAVISTRSKSKFYSGDPEDDVICEEQGEFERDEVGIIRAICVKVCHTLLHGFQYL